MGLKSLATWFQEVFSGCLSGCKKRAREPEPSATVEESECITRYIFEKKRYSKVNKRVKYKAFIPPPNGQMSIYRIDELEDATIWELAREYVEPQYGKRALARADTSAEKVFAESLSIVPNVDPHPRHAEMTGWPSNEDAKQMIAVTLADDAKLILNE